MSKRRQTTMEYDESGNLVGSSPAAEKTRKAPNARTWAIHGLRIDGQGMDVVAEGLTKGQAQKMIYASMQLLKRLYSKVRTVRTVVGDEVDL